MTSLGQDPPTSSYGLLSFKGSDASKFLQGQLSNDMNLLDEHSFVLAGYHNPQGRVLALLRLAALAPDHDELESRRQPDGLPWFNSVK